MENPKQSNNVVKLGHNYKNRSATQEAVEKISNRLLHITDFVMGSLRTIRRKIFRGSN